MTTRAFRTEESYAAEQLTRSRVGGLLHRHGYQVTNQLLETRGSASIQVLEARLPDGPLLRIHVRICWRRDDSPRERLISAAQVLARVKDQDWEGGLAAMTARHERAGHTHSLFVQDSPTGFILAALVPVDVIAAIWARQREVNAQLIEDGKAGRLQSNHSTNGSSPTIWLRDDRYPETPAVADVLWNWPGVVNVMALPRSDHIEVNVDSLDDLSGDDPAMGRDGAQRSVAIRSGYPRDPRVRAAVIKRANGCCERAACAESRNYPGFLDVHHILGIDVSDRTWTCVALCPNCHREAHFSPDSTRLNDELAVFAAQFRRDVQ